MRYVERPPGGNYAHYVDAEWAVHGVAGQEIRVLADACTDLIALDKRAENILFNGPMTVASVTVLQRPKTIGMRLKPGVLAQVVPGMRLDRLRNAELIVSNPFPGNSETEGIRRFVEHLTAVEKISSDPVVDRIVRALELRPTAETLRTALASAPASERVVQRRFLKYVGLTPQQTFGIIRHNDIGRELRGHAGHLADLADRHGYADQSHLTRSFVRFADITPGRFRSETQAAGIVQDEDGGAG